MANGSSASSHLLHSPAASRGAAHGGAPAGVGSGASLLRANCLLAFLVGACVGLTVWPLVVSLLTLNFIRNIDVGDGPGGPVVPQVPAPQQNATVAPPPGENGLSPPAPLQTFVPLKFKDLAGLWEAKQELLEVVECLRTPEKFIRVGARLPKGVLLVGPPGTGKTALARAVATEAGVPLLYASGSEFVEVFVGQGARRVRQLFETARRRAPAIVFIDELDAVGAKRHGAPGGPGGGGGREHDQTLNQLLVELDGFKNGAAAGQRQLVVLAATNRVDTLDSALLRPGRFDRIVYVSLPDRRARELILFKYLQKVPVAEILKKENAQPRRRASSFQKKRRAASEWLRRRRSRASALEADEGPPPDAGGTRAADSGPRKKARGKARKSLVSSAHDGAAHARQVVAKKLAALTPGFSGAELENLVNEAAILAARKNKRVIAFADFLAARDKVTLGAPRGSRLQSDFQRRVTAAHEAGHAVAAFFLQPAADPIHQATIISRGSALGLVEQLPTEDRYGFGFEELLARLCVCMAGRVAERLLFGEGAVSTGASSDINAATQLAFKMVASWGMSRELGPLSYSGTARSAFISSETARQIELEVKALVTDAEERATRILRRHRRALLRLTETLLERETLSGEEIAAVLDPRGKWARRFAKERKNALEKGPGVRRTRWRWFSALWQQLRGLWKKENSSRSAQPDDPREENEESAQASSSTRDNQEAHRDDRDKDVAAEAEEEDSSEDRDEFQTTAADAESELNSEDSEDSEDSHDGDADCDEEDSRGAEFDSEASSAKEKEPPSRAGHRHASLETELQNEKEDSAGRQFPPAADGSQNSAQFSEFSVESLARGAERKPLFPGEPARTVAGAASRGAEFGLQAESPGPAVSFSEEAKLAAAVSAQAALREAALWEAGERRRFSSGWSDALMMASLLDDNSRNAQAAEASPRGFNASGLARWP